MRTTLDIEPDILLAAKEIAAAEGTTAGAIISKLARAGMNASFAAADSKEIRRRNGVEMLPPREEPVTLHHVQSLMDEEGI
jgi:hypothetical protein